MKRSFFYFGRRELLRSANFGKSLATILIGFLALYFGILFLMLGFAIPKILADEFPDADPVSKFNSFLLVYFGFDLFIRQLMQGLPTISLKPFLVLNIKRNRIIRYLLFRSALNFFNLLPLFLLVPVLFSTVIPAHGTAMAIVWLVALIFVVLFNHYFSVYLKWRFNETNNGFYLFVAVFAGLFAANYFGIIDFKAAFGQLMDLLLVQPFLLLSFPILPLVLYFLNQSFLKKKMYLDLLEGAKKDETVRDFSWLSRMGDYGKFISLNIRLIWRNKRPRSQFLMTILFLGYGFLIYKDTGHGVPDVMFVLGGIIMVSMFTAVFGQFFPAWHSKYYPLLMAQNIRMKEFLQSFFVMNAVVCTVYYLCTLPYAFMYPKIVYVNLAVLLYNIGVNPYIIFLFGLNSSKSIDLDGSAFFNYQGVGASQWLISFPLFFGPVLLFYLVKLVAGAVGGYLVLGLLGLAGFLLQPVLINYFSRAFLKEKYTLIKNFKHS